MFSPFSFFIKFTFTSFIKALYVEEYFLNKFNLWICFTLFGFSRFNKIVKWFGFESKENFFESSIILFFSKLKVKIIKNSKERLNKYLWSRGWLYVARDGNMLPRGEMFK